MSVPLPRYAPSIIYGCPSCFGDLTDEGATFHCPACDQDFAWPEVIPCDETDYDRD